MTEPAFPGVAGVAGEDGCGLYTYQYLPNGERAAVMHNQGMTLLDYFAGQALAGMLADPDVNGPPGAVAIIAYNFAEAMLGEREKRCAAQSEKK